MNGRMPSVARAPGRWRAWARERIDRGRRTGRHRPVGMTLLGRDRYRGSAVPARRPSLSFPTHLHLSIHCTVPPRAGAPARGGLGAPTHPTIRAGVLAVQRTPPPLGRSAVSAGWVGRRPRMPRPAARSEWPRPARGGPADGPRSTVPLEPDRRGLPIRHRVDQLVTRLVHGTRRVELPARPAAVVHDCGVPAAPAPPTAPIGQPAGTRDPVAAPRTAAAEAAAPLDLEQLTDRIVHRLDSRLIAHRERFGRAF